MSTLATTNLKHASSGSNNIVLASDGTTTITAPSNIIKSGTSVASTSGTSIDFTSIPSWVKRVTVMFNGVSTNGTSPVQIQLGAGSVTTSGYSSKITGILSTAAPGVLGATGGFEIGDAGSAATSVRHGSVTIQLLSPNVWVATGSLMHNDVLRSYYVQGSISLSGTLDRIRITTVNGTDTFDAGSINILYEG